MKTARVTVPHRRRFSTQMLVLVASEPEAFRRGNDGLRQDCREVVTADPMDGTMFLSHPDDHTALKLRVHDGLG